MDRLRWTSCHAEGLSDKKPGPVNAQIVRRNSRRMGPTASMKLLQGRLGGPSLTQGGEERASALDQVRLRSDHVRSLSQACGACRIFPAQPEPLRLLVGGGRGPRHVAHDRP